MKTSRLLIIITLAILLVLAIGFASSKNAKNSPSNSDKLAVVATFYPLQDFAQQVGGDEVVVRAATPAGSEPHDYEPSPKDLTSYLSSGVFIYNGGAFEPWTAGFLSDYKNVVVKSSQGLELTNNDPHFWLDPVMAKQIVQNIADGLSKAQPANRDLFQQNANSYIVKLNQLDAEISTGLATCKLRTAVTSHAAFTYFAKRYNVNFKPIAGISPEMEPNPASMADLTNYVRTNNIKYVFFEALVSPKLAQTIAQESGAQTAVLDPIEGLSQADQQAGKDYISIQKENLAQLRRALECK